MTTRRDVLRGGLAAFALGMLGHSPRAAAALRRRVLNGAGASSGDPFLLLPASPDSVLVDGMPFSPFYTGDAYRDASIPFHIDAPFVPPAPEEHVDVVVVGGGLAGLTAAWKLRERRPVVLEFRDRFGGTTEAEVWGGVPFSLGGAYVITPDEGSLLDRFYGQLGLDDLRRESFPPDPMELGGEILPHFWTGGGLPAEERPALEAYAQAVHHMAGEGYPDIPVGNDPDNVAWVLELDGKSFRQHVEELMGMPMTPLLAAGVQAYFHSSFCAGMDEISAASGWNFVAAEEYGRWVFPGGNASMARALWEQLAGFDADGPARLRPRSRVVDVRLSGDGALVSWLDAHGQAHSLAARHVVMAGSKHIAQHVLFDLERLDPAKKEAIASIEYGCYLVANVLLDAPVRQDFYDLFLLGDGDFPMDAGESQITRPVVDVLRGDYTRPGAERSVLTLYWPLPFPSARANLLLEGFTPQAERLVPQIDAILALLDLPRAAVRQVRLTRWGHAVPIARTGFIADGQAELVQRPLGGCIHFANQDNWSLPAVENSVLDAHTVARAVESALSGGR